MIFYYVLRCSEDGDVSLTRYSEENLERALTDGDIDASQAALPAFPVYDIASGEWPLTIIRGEVIVPEPVERVTKWRVGAP